MSVNLSELFPPSGGSSGGSGGGLTISPNEPADPSAGDMWLDSVNDIVFIWDGTQWVVFPSSSNQNIDGGHAVSVYTLDQFIDGGSA